MLQKSVETEDLRVRRTRKLLQQALLELTVEKGFPAVTVRDITERAMVNRSTFYRHYLDKYDLLDQYMDEVEMLMSTEVSTAEARRESQGEPPSGLVNLLRHVQAFADFYRVMLGQNGDARFTQRFRQNSERRFRYLLSKYSVDTDPNGPPIDLRLNYVACAGVGGILWWLENGQPCSVEQLALWLSKLTTKSVGLSFQVAPNPPIISPD